jgi:SAM-dependent methyltransferase
MDDRFTLEFFSPGQFSCFYCGGMDRERLVAEYFLRRLGGKDLAPEFRLLEFAPRPAVGAFLKNNFTWRHETADLYMPGVDYQLDISAMPQLKEASFDAWLCLHVLEHVPDDASALRELYRILKPGGFGVLLVPISLTLAATDEDPGSSVEERWRRFGQDDHIRLYAKGDFVARVREAGFTVHELGLDYFGPKCFEELALPQTSVLYVVER